MNHHLKRGLRVALVSGAAFTASALAVPLPPGSNNVPLAGTNSGAEPALAGVIIRDEVRPFQIVGNGAVLFRGEVQHRIVRSNVTGTLYFLWRIRNTQPGLNGIIARVECESFQGYQINANWLDSLAAPIAAPTHADRSGSGSLINYDFLTPVFFSGAESKFFFAFPNNVSEYNADGWLTIYLTTGHSVTMRTFAPGEPCDTCRGDVNSDGVVDFADLNEVIAAFGTTCPTPQLP